MKALIIYGTRGGAATQIADEIGKILGEQGLTTTIEDARMSKGIDVNAYDLVVVGSSVCVTMWKWQETRFFKRNGKKLADKKVALFSSDLAGDDPVQADYARKSIEKTAAKFQAIKSLALASFGGLVDFEHPALLARPFTNAMKTDLEKKGMDTSKPYDTRDFAAIRQWAAYVAAKAKA